MQYPAGRPNTDMDVLWRCEAKRYSVCIDPETDRFGTSAPRLEMWWHRVSRRTPKGAWLGDRFVLLTARKRWACNTEQEALESFVARKTRQIKILSAQLAAAEADLALTQERVFA